MRDDRGEVTAPLMGRGQKTARLFGLGLPGTDTEILEAHLTGDIHDSYH